MPDFAAVAAPAAAGAAAEAAADAGAACDGGGDAGAFMVLALRFIPKDLPPPTRAASASVVIMPKPTTAAKAAMTSRFIECFSLVELGGKQG
jgi:hypothetical protein